MYIVKVVYCIQKGSSMKTSSLLFIGGCSGTTNPSSASDRTEFGTNTTSLGVVVDDVGFFIDNGSGIGNVVDFLKSKKLERVYGLQSHFHLDHCSGIPINKLLFIPGGVNKIFAPRLETKSFQEVIDTTFESHTWPVSPKMFKIQNQIVDFTPGETIKEVWVKTLPVNHPGGSVAYRITLPEGDVVIATDLELSDESSLSKMASFSSGARLMYIDIQYRDCEYEGCVAIGSDTTRMSRKNWGHSTPSMLHKLLESYKMMHGLAPKQIIIGHHDPKRTDRELQIFEKEVIASLREFPIEVSFAHENDTYIID